jgi:hypothetical protein
MALQVGSSCYASAVAAASAIASAETGKVVPAGSVVYVVDAAASSSGSITYTLTDTAGVQPAMVHELVPTIPECGLMDWSDGLALGWGVAAAWLLAYAVLAMRRGL